MSVINNCCFGRGGSPTVQCSSKSSDTFRAGNLFGSTAFIHVYCFFLEGCKPVLSCFVLNRTDSVISFYLIIAVKHNNFSCRICLLQTSKSPWLPFIIISTVIHICLFYLELFLKFKFKYILLQYPIWYFVYITERSMQSCIFSLRFCVLGMEKMWGINHCLLRLVVVPPGSSSFRFLCILVSHCHIIK